MSSEWMIVSPNMVSFGPGGRFSDAMTASNRDNASEPEPPRSAAMSLDCIRLRLKPEPTSLGKNEAGVILAAAVIWATTSCTVHWLHNDGVPHWSSPSEVRSSASAVRSLWTTGQTSTPGISCSAFVP